MKRRTIGILTGIGCVAAIVAVAMYINMYIMEARERQEYLDRLQAQVAGLDGEQLERHRNLARWYNYGLKNGDRNSAAYPSILCFDGVMGWLTLPGEQVLPIHHQGEKDSWAAVHDSASDFPLGAAGEHTVLYLVESPEQAVAQGDILEIYCLNEILHYQVYRIREGVYDRDSRTAGEGLTLLVPGENTTQVISCNRVTQAPEVVKTEEPKVSGAAPAGAAAGAVALPVAVWGLRESLGKLTRKSKRNRKNDEKARKSVKTINKSRVSRK